MAEFGTSDAASRQGLIDENVANPLNFWICSISQKTREPVSDTIDKEHKSWSRSKLH
jgi:hypothetical protein